MDYEYPVYFTEHLFDSNNDILIHTVSRLKESRKHRAMVCIDSGVTDTHPDLIKKVEDYFHLHSELIEMVCEPVIIPGGEKIKQGWESVRDLMTAIGNHNMCRQSYIICIGGGSVLDMVGFAASLIHRGLRLIRIPTTVLAQNDAGIGVKNGMNEHGTKNFIGTFAPPFGVINDFSFLNTLSFRDWVGGIAEAFKVAMIKDRDFFAFLCEQAETLRNRDMKNMQELIKRCGLLHLEHIRTSGDPFEFGTARPLDFGHWLGHELESMTDYTIGHGQGVSIGIAVDSFYAMKKGFITSEEYQKTITGLYTSGLPVYHELLEKRSAKGRLEVLNGLDRFREHLGGRLTVTLPKPIGEKCELHEMDDTIIENALQELSESYSAMDEQHANIT